MPPKSNKAGRILGRVAREHFVGRGEALRELVALAAPAAPPRSVLLLAAPHAGASELLRQTYDELFAQRGGASPVYFDFTRKDRTASAAARRFLHTFLAQAIAHRRHDPALVPAAPPLRALLDLASPSDYEWVEGLVESFERAQGEGDERSLVRVCFGAPRLAAARGARTLVLLDDVHAAEHLGGEVELGPELAQAAAQAGVPFALAGLRRRLLDLLNGAAALAGPDSTRTIHLSALRDADARALLEHLARERGVALNDETRDLAVQQLGGSPAFISALVGAASAARSSLESFRDFQKLYVDELMGGAIHRRFSAVLEEAAPSPALRRGLLRVLHESATNVGGKSPVEVWLKRLGLDALELERLMRALHAHELASFQATYVEDTPGPVWSDFLRASYRLQVSVEPRALVVADTLVEALKRAPRTMARHYRRESALRLGDLLRRFDFQRVPASLLHYDRYARLYRGVPADEVAAGLEAETDLVRLPQIVHSASCAWFHPPVAQVCDEERCAVAHGFDTAAYADSGEVVWVAAEVESKLEAGRALTEVWLDRLAQVAAACGFERVRLWLVAPEGFSADASELLHERGAFGSSRRQLELLAARLGAGVAPEAANEFAMEIPMGEDTELIAAHTVEQIARRMEFEPEAINQIKTALVEACINATEHSLSTERKIYNRFRVEDDKLVITVSSRGLSAPGYVSDNGASFVENHNGHESGEGLRGRRGWGLKVIRTLMDDVEFERVDDGTRLRMTKYLRK
ncbi:MAG TPA: ATP-binding protein [Pyrinomonadaceae bacterium]|nr:ATP-binding protein [Pyrinomonadaceae bacterium]